VVRVADGERDGLVRHFKSEHIGCEVYYPLPLTPARNACVHLGHRDGGLPRRRGRRAASVLALPMFPELTMDQQRRVIQSCGDLPPMRSRMAA